jgi:hypothetical protein
MNTAPISTEEDPSPVRRTGGLRWPYVILVVIIVMAATAGLSYWFLSQYVFLREFKPVALKPEEEQALNTKLQSIGIDVKRQDPDDPFLEPEPYSEAGASREVVFTEREINALLAKNTDLARKLAIDFSDDLVSAKLLIPLDDDFPVLGGKTLRVNAGVEMTYKDRRPVIVLKGVSVFGVPIPNAWLGNLKNVDLVAEFDGNQGFWKTFSDGVETIQVTDGRLFIKLKE